MKRVYPEKITLPDAKNW